jgi:signal transduction histidine kinase
VRGDERSLARMLDDLTAAAVAASPPGSRVDVSIRPAADGWTIEITDPTPPPGIDPAGQPGQPGGASRHGAGLGQILSRAIAERHGGTMTVRPAPGGSIVRVHLPPDETGG